MNRLALGAICMAVLLFLQMTGCTTIGPELVLNSHVEYNKAVKQVISEELLLNIVRRRYAEPPQFVQVSTITTTLGLSANASADAGWSRSGGSDSSSLNLGAGGASGGVSRSSTGNAFQFGSVGVSGGVAFSDTPTVTITPLSGESIANPLTKRMSYQTIGKLVNAGYRPDYVMAVMVDAFTNTRGPYVGTGDSFRPGTREYVEVLERLGSLFDKDQLMVGTWRWEDPYGDIAYTPDQITTDNQIATIALGEDLGRWRSYDGGKTYVFTDHSYYAAMYIPEEARTSEDGKRVIELLNLQEQPLKKIWYFQPAKVLMGPDLTINEDKPRMDVRMLVRSFYAVLTFLSYGVEVPPEDEATGRAIPAEPYHNAVREGLAVDLSDKFVVHWSKNRPDDAYLAVEHRGTWFYIDDGDYHSKFFFAGLYDLFNIEVIPPSDSQGPILTIPVN